MKLDLYRLFHPKFWMQNYPTNWEWDAMLNEWLDNGDPTDIGHYYCTINGRNVWIANWPYAFGMPIGLDILPSAPTRVRLRILVKSAQDAIKADAISKKWKALRS